MSDVHHTDEVSNIQQAMSVGVCGRDRNKTSNIQHSIFWVGGTGGG